MSKEPMETLGSLIRSRREQKGITRTNLSRMTDISPNSMVKYEMAGTPNGKYPSLINAAKIAKVLKIDPRYMFETLLYTGDVPEETGTDEFGAPNSFSFIYTIKAIAKEWEEEYRTNEVTHLSFNIHSLEKHIEKLDSKLDQLITDKKENGSD